MSITAKAPGKSTVGAPDPGSMADDALKDKSRDASVISGGHLRAKALETEGVDKSFTRCGALDTARRG